MQGECVVHRCQNKNPKGWPVDVNDVMHRKRTRGGFWKKVSWVEFCLGRRWLAFACSPKPGQWPLWQVPHVLWERGRQRRWKSQNRKNVYLSPYVEEPLNSKVIKSFVPEQSHKCFSCFKIPMFYVYMLRTLWTFCVLVWICPFIHFLFHTHTLHTYTHFLLSTKDFVLQWEKNNFRFLFAFFETLPLHKQNQNYLDIPTISPCYFYSHWSLIVFLTYLQKSTLCIM